MRALSRTAGDIHLRMTEPVTNPEPRDTSARAREPEWRLEDLLDLFVRPSRFFASRTPFAADDAILIVAWLAGMNSAIGRIEQRMVRADAGGSAVPGMIAESWLGFWVTVILAGLLSGLLLWHLGAWWYRVRLNWSGADEPHSERARVVFLYSRLVWAAPALLTQVLDTFRFEDYRESWDHESLLPLVLLVFPFWSFIVSYRGLRTVFDVRRGPALWWFLIAPSLVFLFAVGALGALAAGVVDLPSP